MKSRKTNRAKRVSPGCKNNGSCKVCQGNRTHANRRAEPADAVAQVDVRVTAYPYSDEDYDEDPYGDLAWWEEQDDMMALLTMPDTPGFTFGEVLAARAP